MGTSVVRRLVGIYFLTVLGALFLAAPAFPKGGAVQATDPSAGSPAGVVYSIPLDSARQDAAPHGHSGSHSGGPGVGGSGGSGGGGSSSGGAASGGSGTSGGSSGSSGDSGASLVASSSSTPVLVPGGQPGSLVHSSNGFGSSSRVPSLSSPATGLGAVQTNASSAPLLAFLLAAVVLLLGGYVGVRAWRTAAARGGAEAAVGGEPPQLPPPAE